MVGLKLHVCWAQEKWKEQGLWGQGSLRRDLGPFLDSGIHRLEFVRHFRDTGYRSDYEKYAMCGKCIVAFNLVQTCVHAPLYSTASLETLTNTQFALSLYTPVVSGNAFLLQCQCCPLLPIQDPVE